MDPSGGMGSVLGGIGGAATGDEELPTDPVKLTQAYISAAQSQDAPRMQKLQTHMQNLRFQGIQHTIDSGAAKLSWLPQEDQDFWHKEMMKRDPVPYDKTTGRIDQRQIAKQMQQRGRSPEDIRSALPDYGTYGTTLGKGPQDYKPNTFDRVASFLGEPIERGEGPIGGLKGLLEKAGEGLKGAAEYPSHLIQPLVDIMMGNTPGSGEKAAHGTQSELLQPAKHADESRGPSSPVGAGMESAGKQLESGMTGGAPSHVQTSEGTKQPSGGSPGSPNWEPTKPSTLEYILTGLFAGPQAAMQLAKNQREMAFHTGFAQSQMQRQQEYGRQMSQQHFQQQLELMKQNPMFAMRALLGQARLGHYGEIEGEHGLHDVLGQIDHEVAALKAQDITGSNPEIQAQIKEHLQRRADAIERSSGKH